MYSLPPLGKRHTVHLELEELEKGIKGLTEAEKVMKENCEVVVNSSQKL